MPERYRDDVPQPLTSLPPSIDRSATHPSVPASQPSMNSDPTQDSTQRTSVSQNPILKLFRTTRNFFGLSRRYYSDVLPSHDPEENFDLNDRSDTYAVEDGSCNEENSPRLFHPYPNKNSLLLGEWYWNSGHQKSQQSFKELLDIVGDPQFKPGDVQGTNWKKIDATLAQSDVDEEEAGWSDDDAGWMKTPITISVPFHSRAKSPGVHDFCVGHFYHRSLTSVIREKLTNHNDHPHFHYDPFELIWTPSPGSEDVRVHGELYNSSAFLDAHRELQESQREPGCNLPRVVLGMMFASDVTHLTSFGTAKLWPCYLFFGNDSKYRRCKPNCHLCSHVAYFQAVRFPQFSSVRKGLLTLSLASRFVQGLRQRENGPWRIYKSFVYSLPPRTYACPMG